MAQLALGINEMPRQEKNCLGTMKCHLNGTVVPFYNAYLKMETQVNAAEWTPCKA